MGQLTIRLLPLLLVLGGYLVHTIDIPLETSETAMTTFVLADRASYSSAMVRTALGYLHWRNHELWVSGKETGRVGRHLEWSA